VNKFIILIASLIIGSCSSSERIPLEKPELAMRPSSTPFIEDDLFLEDYINALKEQAASLKIKKQNMVFGLREINSELYADALYKVINVYETTKDR